MFTKLKAFACLALCGVMLAGCAQGSGKQEETTAPVTQAPTTEPVETTVPATTSAPATADEAVRLDNRAIKQSLSEIEATLDGLIDKTAFKGAVYAKVGNDFEYLKALGVANEGTHVNNSAYIRFYAGSVTKLLTATAVMKLAEEKLLDINATIDKYFPNCSYAKNVTVKQLLNMTSGIPDYICNARIDYREVKKPVPELRGSLGGDYINNKTAVLSWILSQPVAAAEKPVFAYSESNYYLLGEIIAKASGKRYEDYVSAAIFKPAYMTKSGFGADDSVANPYIPQGSEELLNDGVGYSAFGLITNVSDLLKLIDGLLSYQIISENSIKEIITDNGSGFGYGVYVSGNSLLCIGKTDAYSAKLSFSDDKSRIFVALSNNSYSDPNLLHRLFRNYLEKFSV